jgi:polyhydroxybutyrate depolymerase
MRSSHTFPIAIALAVVACRSASGRHDDQQTEGAPTTNDAPTSPGPAGVETSTAAKNEGDQGAGGMTVTTESVNVLGNPRPYLLVVPATYAGNSAYPLVLVLHGDGGDGASMHDSFPFEAVSGQKAIVAYPSGDDRSWDLYTPSATNADEAYLVALVNAVRAKLDVDPSRIFATGFSSGAFMVNQVGCRMPTFFRAIAPQSGGAPSEPNDPTASRWENGYTKCTSQTLGAGPAVLAVHGTVDTTVVFDSGEFTSKYWAYIDGCATTRGADTLASCQRYDGCAPSRPVVFCPIEGLGHRVWDHASTTIWGFFGGL